MDILNEELNRVKELMGIISESPEPLYEGMDASNIDLENAAETDEDDWLMDNWDDLDENIKETFRQHEEFSGLDDSQIKQKFNSMDSGSLCKIARFLFGWVVRLVRPLTNMDKQMRGGMGGKGYKPAWRCR